MSGIEILGAWADPETRRGLREPFPKEQIGKIPASRGRPALDFVGHAAVTDRLNAVAPGWFYTIDEVFTVGNDCWIRGTFTVGNVSRPEFGDGSNPKEAIGNFIRRGAMRFGVALDLWSREELTENSPTPESSKPRERSADGARATAHADPVGVHRPTRDGDAAGSHTQRDSLPSFAPGGAVSGPTTARKDDPAPDSSSIGGETAPNESGGPESPSPPGEGAGSSAAPGDGAGESNGEAASPAPTSRRDQLWANLLDFAGSQRAAVSAVNKACKSSWQVRQFESIPEDDLEITIRHFALMEPTH